MKLIKTVVFLVNVLLGILYTIYGRRCQKSSQHFFIFLALLQFTNSLLIAAEF